MFVNIDFFFSINFFSLYLQLSNVIRNQKCEYEFQFHKIEFNTNLNILVLSEGKSMLPW